MITIIIMDFRHLRYFLAVVDSGSVAAAARQLHIVQPALSPQIRDLEEELGAALFSRNARGVELTAAGAQFVLDAWRLLIDIESARQRALRVAQGSAGTLRIGVSATYGWHPTILSHINNFRQSHPDISLYVEPAARGEADGRAHRKQARRRFFRLARCVRFALRSGHGVQLRLAARRAGPQR